MKSINQSKEDSVIKIKKAIGISSLALTDLRKFIVDNKFKNKQEEIHFFKHIKPPVYAKFLYYSKLLKIECNRPTSTINFQKQYLELSLVCLEKYFANNSVFYKYNRLKLTEMDDKYFLRGCKEVPQSTNDLHFLIDKEFSTCHDGTKAKIMAHEMLIDYIKSDLEELENLKSSINTTTNESKKYELQWTESKIALVELIYALHSSGAINKGIADIKKLAKCFEEVFNIELGEYYRTYLEIRNRKIDRTKFLDSIKESLLKRMNDADK